MLRLPSSRQIESFLQRPQGDAPGSVRRYINWTATGPDRSHRQAGTGAADDERQHQPVMRADQPLRIAVNRLHLALHNQGSENFRYPCPDTLIIL